jgi:succinate dehydrogenase / fumarate reductase cytochrome b subunit
MSHTDEIHSRRPTSPHLSIYKKQISSVMSVFHRLTGIGLFIGFSIITWWMVFWVFSKFDPQIFGLMNNLMVRLSLYALSASFFYHLCTGIRHLFWDMGYGYDIPVMHKTGWLAIICAALLTIFFWVII